MKKIIAILVLVVFVASIAVVNFFGLEIKIFDGIEYVTAIQCDSVTIRNENSYEIDTPEYRPDGTPVFSFTFIPAPSGQEYTSDEASILTNPNAVELNYKVLPPTADDNGVRFEYDAEQMEGVAVFREDLRTIIFLKPDRTFTITIRATDGSNVSTSVAIKGSLSPTSSDQKSQDIEQ